MLNVPVPPVDRSLQPTNGSVVKVAQETDAAVASADVSQLQIKLHVLRTKLIQPSSCLLSNRSIKFDPFKSCVLKQKMRFDKNYVV